MPILRDPRLNQQGMARTDYTDLAVVIGPDRRWAEEDYLDLVDQCPEVLLGYRVMPMSAREVISSPLRGRPVAKVVLLEGVYDRLISTWADRLQRELRRWEALGTKIEAWHVHRVRGIWRIG